jgi:hypothetical protein
LAVTIAFLNTKQVCTGNKRGEAEEKTKEGKKGREMLISVVLTLNK